MRKYIKNVQEFIEKLTDVETYRSNDKRKNTKAENKKNNANNPMIVINANGKIQATKNAATNDDLDVTATNI